MLLRFGLFEDARLLASHLSIERSIRWMSFSLREIELDFSTS
jgi:hypothetical protein